jgi:cytoskeletal protein CcmA (bactofilin family)
MFGRKGADGEHEGQDTAHNESPPIPVARMEPHAAPRAATPNLARRVVPGSSRSAISSEDRRLTVGKGLSVAGEITSCDVLVVEGKVEAKLSDGKMLEITESGQFRGSVEIENADIAGRYDGQLTVHGRLTVRATGRISGMVKYGELEISAGGQIIGELQVTSAGVAASQEQRGNGFKSAAKFAATTDEEDQETKAAAERKSA